MKQDLDLAMADMGLDAFVLTGDATLDPDVFYMTNGALLEGAMIMKKRGEAPVLIHSPIEQHAAEQSGLALINRQRWDFRAILSRFPDRFDAMVEYQRQILSDLGVQGRVAFLGKMDAGYAYRFIGSLLRAMPAIQPAAEFESIFERVRQTKDAAEITALRQVGEKTTQVVQAVVDLIQRQAVRQGILVKADGQPFTIGDVKAFMRAQFFDLGLLDDGTTIFAQGADGADPHHTGNDAEALRLGSPIVFDIFPKDQRSGYYHDMTRTFCIGYAPPHVQAVYDTVLGAFDAAVAALRVGEASGVYQTLVCDYFEARGYTTIRQDRMTTRGYNHSLGHGLGLQVHEAPILNDMPGFSAPLLPGAVITIEPGLYDAEAGYGVRIEDTFFADAQGAWHSLSPFPKNLVIPMD